MNNNRLFYIVFGNNTVAMPYIDFNERPPTTQRRNKKKTP